MKGIGFFLHLFTKFMKRVNYVTFSTSQIRLCCCVDLEIIFGLRTILGIHIKRAKLCFVKNSYVYSAGTRLHKYFEKRCKELGLNFDESFQEPKVKRTRFDNDNIEENCRSDSEDDEAQKRR